MVMLKRRFRKKGTRVPRRTFVSKYARSKKNIRTTKTTAMTLKYPTTIPDRMRVKLSYNTYVTLTGGVGTPFGQFYQNSLFDPDLTGVGNQPLGFDQWSAFYGKYRVTGIAIKVQGANTNSTNPMQFAVYPTLQATVPTTVNAVLSQPYLKMVSTGQSSGNAKLFVKSYMSTKKMFGLKSIDQEDNFSALVTANPSDLWYWCVWGYCGAGTTPTFQGLIKITYYCEFFDRVALEMS